MWRYLYNILVTVGLSFALLGAHQAVAEKFKFSWTISGVTDPGTPIVVLLHGLSRSQRSMRPLAEALVTQGYRVINMDYHASQYPIDELGRQLGRALDRCCNPAPVGGFNFITHSLGGIVLRQYAQQTLKAPIARVVMLAPPNQGSELADKLGNIPFYKYITGPAGQQVGTDSDSVPNRLGPVSFELGVIAGSSSLNPLYSWLIPGPDDGKVSVSKTRVAGLRDFIVLDVSHSFMMSNSSVIHQSLQFLQQGNFEHPQ
jgi:triacylglycerol lipase